MLIEEKFTPLIFALGLLVTQHLRFLTVLDKRTAGKVLASMSS